MPYTVFISHSVDAADYALVVQLHNLIWQQGMQAIVAEWQPAYGAEVSAKVSQQIEASDAVLAVLTSTSSRSSFVGQEIGYAKRAGKTVIPLVEQGVQPTGFLFGTDSLVFSRWDYSVALQTLAGYLTLLKSSKEQRQTFALVSLLAGGLFIWGLSQQRAAYPE